MMARTALSSVLTPRGSALHLLAVVAVLATSLASGFLMDDWFHVERAARSLAGGALDFTLDTREQGIRLWVHPEPVRVRFLRPVSSLSFWIDRQVWGLRAWGFHLTNIGVHLLAILGLFALAREVGLSRGMAGRLSTAWGVSAASVPAVQWISGRTEILCGAAALGAVLAFLRWDRSRRARDLALAIALAALAVGSKENGVAVAPIAWCLLRVRRALTSEAPARGRAAGLALLLLPAAAAVALRVFVLRLPVPEAPYSDPVRTLADAVWFALKPVWALIATLASLPVSPLGPLAFLRAHPALAVAALGIGGWLVFTVCRAAGWRVAAPLLAAFLAALAPSLPVQMTTLYFYLPAAPLALLVGAAATRHPRHGAWLVLWIVVGSIAHLGIAALTMTASRHQQRQLAFFADSLPYQRCERLVLIDAPFWTYGLPAAWRANDPSPVRETWFVNFTPRLAHATPSTLAWTSPLELRVRLTTGQGLLASPVEQFLAFGGSAERTMTAGPAAPLSITAAAPGPHPSELAVRFSPDARHRGSCIVRFVRGRAERVPFPASFSPGSGPSAVTVKVPDRPDGERGGHGQPEARRSR